MAIRNLLHKNVPSAELNERARETRVRLERLERLLVPRVEEQSLWLRPLVRLVSFHVERNARRTAQTRGSMADPGRGCMPETASISSDDIGEPPKTAEATKSPVGAAAQRGSAGCDYTDRPWPSMRSCRTESVSGVRVSAASPTLYGPHRQLRLRAGASVPPPKVLQAPADGVRHRTGR